MSHVKFSVLSFSISISTNILPHQKVVLPCTALPTQCCTIFIQLKMNDIRMLH